MNMITKTVQTSEGPKTISVKGPEEKIDNTDLVNDFRARGGKIIHLRPGNIGMKRGVTFAYIPKGNRMEVASALTHTVDTFCKKKGTKTAIEHFDAGKTITLPVCDLTTMRYLFV